MFESVQIVSGGYGIIWNDDIDLNEYERWTKGVEVSTINDLAYKAA